MYVKYKNETTIEPAPKVLRDDQNTYANPLPETLEKFGYKPLVETECPSEEGYFYTFEYNETEDQVTKTWVAHEIEPEPEPDPEEPTVDTEVDTELDTEVETPAENVQEDAKSGRENVQEVENTEE